MFDMFFWSKIPVILECGEHLWGKPLPLIMVMYTYLLAFEPNPWYGSKWGLMYRWEKPWFFSNLQARNLLSDLLLLEENRWTNNCFLLSEGEVGKTSAFFLPCGATFRGDCYVLTRISKRLIFQLQWILCAFDGILLFVAFKWHISG